MKDIRYEEEEKPKGKEWEKVCVWHILVLTLLKPAGLKITKEPQ